MATNQPGIDFSHTFKIYFKYAAPVAALFALGQELFMESGMLFKPLNLLVRSMSSEDWLSMSGTESRSGVRGAEYYKGLNLSIYDRE